MILSPLGNVGRQEVSRCRTRGDSGEFIERRRRNTQAKDHLGQNKRHQL